MLLKIDKLTDLHCEARKGYCNKMLGPNPYDRGADYRPFMWKATDNPEWDGVKHPNKCGVSLSFSLSLRGCD